MTGPRPYPLRMGVACLFRSRYNDNEEGVQPNLDALLARSALPFSQGAESYDAELYSSIHVLDHPFDTPVTADLNPINTLKLSNTAQKTTTNGLPNHLYEKYSSDCVLDGGYQADPPSSCGAPSTAAGRGVTRRPHQKRGRANVGGEKEAEKEEDRGDGEGRRPPKRRHLGSGQVPQYFACPYYKRDPWRYWRCYCKYAFKRVADVKGHLERIHTISEYYCPICFAGFSDNESWGCHTHENTCEPTQPPEHVLTVQRYEEISQAFSDARRSSDWDKWYLIYNLVFPSATYRPASPYVYLTFDDPLGIMRERAFRDEVSNGRILTALQQLGVPLQGIDLVFLQTRVINAVLPTLAEATATNMPPQTLIPPPLALSWDEFVEPQNLPHQDLQSQQLGEAPEEDQQDDQLRTEQLPEQQWPF
ncbi:unnamed protein product [Clonostachys chloroleuca]|uniref:C2H2-type domain-containing protein n=1 Tax=Clonostachys chloroleuca TaxID=1926264 RepID=A0AA35MDH0_9HYPO|nr:unnamed protein product [Clonostachys chloroleuca]